MTLDESTGASPLATVLRLLEAANRHDLDALVACFSPDYVNETPAHPLRGFTGRGQVRRNWERIFAAAPNTDLSLVSHSVDGPRIWTELALEGTLADGSPSSMAGVAIFRVDGPAGGTGRIIAAKFYLEPVERSSGNVDDAIGRLTHTPAPTPAPTQGGVRP